MELDKEMINEENFNEENLNDAINMEMEIEIDAESENEDENENENEINTENEINDDADTNTKAEDENDTKSEKRKTVDVTDLIAKKIIEILSSSEYNICQLPSAFCATQISIMLKSGQLNPYFDQIKQAILFGKNDVILTLPLQDDLSVKHIVAFCHLLSVLKYKLAFKSSANNLTIQVSW